MSATLRTAASILHHFTGGAKVVGEVRGSLMLFRADFPHYDYWMLTDNGGEVNVERVNCPEGMVSVAMNCDAATLAYRIACVMDGTPIDYAYRMEAEDTGFLLTLNAA